MAHEILVVNENIPGINPVSLGQQHCAPGHRFGPAVRTYWLLHYVVSGHGIFRREGQTHRLSAGDIFVIPPYLSTYYEADAQEPWHYIWVGFTSTLPLPTAFDHPVIRCSGAKRPFEDMLLCRDMEAGRSPFLCSRIWELMARLREAERGGSDYVTKALSLMEASYHQKLTVSDLAQQLGLERSYFSTLFRQKMGRSPGAYLLELRLQKAATLMVEHGQSPAVAAASVGYEDLSHFSKLFKKHFGLSPRQYKEHTLLK